MENHKRDVQGGGRGRQATGGIYREMVGIGKPKAGCYGVGGRGWKTTGVIYSVAVGIGKPLAEFIGGDKGWKTTGGVYR